MALDKTNLPISFAQGVDTKTDRKQVLPGKLLSLENGVFQTTNSIIKRNGYAALSTSTIDGSTISNNVGLASFRDSLFAVNNGASYTYSPNAAKWSNSRGPYYPVTVTQSQGGNVEAFYADSVYDSASGLMCTVTASLSYGLGSIEYIIKDLANDTLVYKKIIGALSLLAPHVFKLGSYFVITYVDGSNNLVYRSIPISNPSSLGSQTTIAATGSSPGNFGAYPAQYYEGLVNNNILYIGYPDGGSTANTSLRTINSSFVVSSATTISSANCTLGLGMCADASNNIWFGTNDGTTIKTFAFPNNLGTSIVGVTNVASRTGGVNMTGVALAVLPGTSTKIRFFYEQCTTSEIDNPWILRYSDILYSGNPTISVTASNKDYLVGGHLFSKPFTYNSKLYITATFYDGATVSLYLVEADVASTTTENDVRVLAKMFSQNVLPLDISTISIYPLVNFIATSSSAFSAYINQIAGNCSYGTIDFSHTPVFAELGNGLHVTGGFLYLFDGNQLAEHNFFTSPSDDYIAVSNSGAGSVPTGTYYYAITYEWIDNSGQIHYSGVGASSAIVLGSASKVLIKYPLLRLTNKTDNIYIGIYRSNDGLNYYLLPGTGVNGTTFNFKGSTSCGSFYDDNSAAFLNDGPRLLYTSGGVLPNISVPACTYIANYKKRLIVIPSEQPTTWWYSQEITPSQYGSIGTPVQFSEELIGTADERGGGITGVIQLDDKLVLFKKSSIFVVQGDGPAPNGSQNDFTPAQLIASDTGATSGQSLVLMPNGIMYQSAKGIYLLDRSISVSYLGAPVEAYNSYNVVSAKMIYNLNQIRFGLSSGVALVYNYLFNQWSVFTNHSMTQAAIFQQKYTYSSSAGVCYQETPGVYSDAGTDISMKLTTSWLSFAQLQGFQRVYKLLLLGEYYTPHILKITVAVDFIPTIVQTTQIICNATTVNPSTLYQWRYFFERQKCQSLQFTIEDLPVSVGVALGQGYAISNMAFEVGTKKGLVKKPAANSVG